MTQYTSASKLTWRGWVWNRIAERIPKLKRRDAIILYLVGPEDLDREVALKKGFRDENLIAVDRDKDCVKAARARGSLAIEASLEDLLVAWPKDLPLGAVLADFTCGLDKAMNLFQGALLISAGIKQGTVIAVNLQRGRDADSNVLRRGLKAAKETLRRQGMLHLTGYSSEFDDILLDELHRGKQMYSNLLYHCMNSIAPPGTKLRATILQHSESFLAQTKPVFYSYRQTVGQPYMDSVVFSMPLGTPGLPRDELVEFYTDWRRRDPMALYGRKIAALRAVRTMKLQGRL